MKILVAQINPIVGDLAGNTVQIVQAIEKGRSQQADLVLFPELSISGYPPEDFLLLPQFVDEVYRHLEIIIQAASGLAAIVGLPRQASVGAEKKLYNSAAIIHNQKLEGFADKILLPTYDVFDERRYFQSGEFVKCWAYKGERIGISICEDLWQHSGFLKSMPYTRDPVLEMKLENPTLLLNLSASPYSKNKLLTRLQVCLKASASLKCPVILCNQVGGNDSLIFDGYSLFVDTKGLIKHAEGFVKDDLFIDLSMKRTPLFTGVIEQQVLADQHQALILGIKDYFRKSGFKKACLGLSGGIDSALVACLAVEALGPSNVLALGMPSRYSSPESSRDAKELAKRLQIEYLEIPIESPFESYLSLLSHHFEGMPSDVTEENLQARIRGMLLMAFSNKFGYLILSTGNKSELALGYSTLYGDMCGGLAVIGDLTKGDVYALSRWINRHEEIIPSYTIDRQPTAELRPNQKDSDSLPDYQLIDQVLQSYVEEHHSPEWISEHFNYPYSIVQSLIRRIHANEYKRRQSPPVLRVTEKAFSIGRRFPIVQKWV